MRDEVQTAWGWVVALVAPLILIQAAVSYWFPLALVASLPATMLLIFLLKKKLRTRLIIDEEGVRFGPEKGSYHFMPFSAIVSAAPAERWNPWLRASWVSVPGRFLFTIHNRRPLQVTTKDGSGLTFEVRDCVDAAQYINSRIEVGEAMAGPHR